MQSRRMSFFEQCVATAIGFVTAMIMQWALMPALGIETSHGQDLTVVLAFTLLSLVRGYCVRRFFNWWHHRPAKI